MRINEQRTRQWELEKARKGMVLMDLSTLTRKQIEAMEPGPEMAAAVATACGIDSWNLGGCTVIQMDGNEGGTEFAPFEDWNDAMLAAERFGLFTTHGCIVGNGLGGPVSIEQWCVRKPHLECDMRPEISVFCKSGPLAICRAILILYVEQRG